MTQNLGDSKTRRRKDILAGVIVLVALSSLAYWMFAASRYEMRWSVMWDYREPFFSGWLATLGIAAVALVASTLLGGLVIVGRHSKFAAVRGFFVIVIELARGTPLIVQILFGFYVVAPHVGLESPLIVGIAVLSLFSGAYLGEIFRGGIESVPASQLEAARAVGFSQSQIMRYVVIPQAMRRVLPAVAGQFANLVKDSSLLYVIAVGEVTYEARRVIAASFTTLESYAVLAVAYLVITLPIFWFSRRLERAFSSTLR